MKNVETKLLNRIISTVNKVVSAAELFSLFDIKKEKLDDGSKDRDLHKYIFIQFFHIELSKIIFKNIKFTGITFQLNTTSFFIYGMKINLMLAFYACLYFNQYGDNITTYYEQIHITDNTDSLNCVINHFTLKR